MPAEAAFLLFLSHYFLHQLPLQHLNQYTNEKEVREEFKKKKVKEVEEQEEQQEYEQEKKEEEREWG